MTMTESFEGQALDRYLRHNIIEGGAGEGGLWLDAVGNEHVGGGFMELHQWVSWVEMEGRLAAAMAWPWRFSFSSGM